MRKDIPINKLIPTNDRIIRIALRTALEKDIEKINLNSKHPLKIFEEFGVRHGMARIDIAVINDIMHGYEIKSDRDTLKRLLEQMNEYNTVFDKITLVVGRRHLYNAINIIPDWWGIMIAKIDKSENVAFYNIRKADDNPEQIGVSIARLLWRGEALQILEDQNKAKGFRSKPRDLIYKRLASVLDTETLKDKVKDTLLVSRKDWRSDVQLMSSGD
jgi:hypothetical protein